MNNPSLGEKLLRLRKEMKMTQDDVAKILGMSRTSFSKYENGNSAPPLQVLRKIAAIYNVGLEYLIFDENTSIRLNDSQSEDENTSSVPVSKITELRPVEKQIIGKYRILTDEEKKLLLEKLFPEYDDKM
ncbi:MAG: helix-turn-helix transcriptional regulator [Clostridiaceae bacterium]|nr:helix-turn-helix transcriptional regulator [Clostridiaceae bacterium]MDY5888587.1 helix-turn-helix transcriptional regulator [Oscillospiraceae bacterium]